MVTRDLKRIDEYEKVWRERHGEPIIPDFVHGARAKGANRTAFHTVPTRSLGVPSTSDRKLET